jgi:methionyl-tRNA formyltransferase
MFTLYLLTRKGFEVLKALIASGHASHIDRVVVGTDKHVQHDYSREIQDLCASHHVLCIPRQQALEVASPLSIAISWRWMIDKQPTKLIVLHDSLLPKYRGFAPLVTALMNGDEEIGVTALYAANEYDRGDIIFKSSSKITYPIRIAEAIERVSQNYVSIVLSIFEHVLRGQELPRTPQNETEATYSLWRDEQDYLIPWGNDASSIRRFIDATGYPYLGACAFLDSQKIRILAAEERPDVLIVNRTPGKVISTDRGCPVVVCGKGLLRLTEVIDDQTGNTILPFPRLRIRL